LLQHVNLRQGRGRIGRPARSGLIGNSLAGSWEVGDSLLRVVAISLAGYQYGRAGNQGRVAMAGQDSRTHNSEPQAELIQTGDGVARRVAGRRSRIISCSLQRAFCVFTGREHVTGRRSSAVDRTLASRWWRSVTGWM
ncbi:Fungal transcriptional regulatory, partial [Cordyceps militaris]